VVCTEHFDFDVGAIELRPVRTEIERSLEYCRLALMLVSPRARVESFLTIESVAKTGERVVRRSKALLPWSAVGPVEMVNGALWAEATRWVAGIVQDWRGKSAQIARALRSFDHACARREYDDRYELFCRSIETVLQTDMGKGRQQLAEGIRLVLGDSSDVPSIDSLEKHYLRRNAIVHGHRFLDPDSDDEQTVNEMETLARRFMLRLITDRGTFEAIMKLQGERVEARAARQLRERT